MNAPLRLLLLSIVTTTITAAAACSRPSAPPAPVQLTVEALTPGGKAVAGVRLWADGRELGRTDASGRLSQKLAGRVELTSACPAGYHGDSTARVLNSRSPHQTKLAPEPITIRLRCEPLLHLAAVVVRAEGGPGLPVLIDGEPAAQTDAEGLVHLMLERPPGSSLRVAIDTTSEPSLRPQNPVQTFHLEQGDSILLFDQKLSRRRRRRHVPSFKAPALHDGAPNEPPRPYRIQ
ncbi:MAG: hypothetical protein OEZ06_02430 [Myxococcales bacterium]|nr:hypothetical protein [Myxococcales bacterium]